jgi:hypothetical protein
LGILVTSLHHSGCRNRAEALQEAGVDASNFYEPHDFWATAGVRVIPKSHLPALQFILVSGLSLAMMAFSRVAWRVAFASDLSQLKRAPARLTWRSIYRQMASRHTAIGLTMGFLGSLLFVAAGIFMLGISSNYSVALCCIVFFGLCAVAWGYALYLKFGLQESSSDDHG